MIPRSTFRRGTRFVLKALGAVLIVAAVAGAIYEQVGQRRDRARLPRVGHAVDIVLVRPGRGRVE